ncbi:MAG: ankyrin repeat domain-containing protein [Cyclobacteriaceae bacterium]|nr:ankyrin repeat domain-containing protein [Cyclobacteriaceae bacterium]
MSKLKNLIANNKLSEIHALIENNPELLLERDENNTSGFMMLAYAGMSDVLHFIQPIHDQLNFYECIVGKLNEKAYTLLSEHPEIINQHSPDGFTPLSLAVFFDNEEIAISLLKSGADPSLKAINPSKVNALHAAVAKENLSLCKMLIAYGADVNSTQTQNITPLHAAAYKNNKEIVLLLINNGAELSIKTTDGKTAFDIAVEKNFNEITQLLIPDAS